MSGDKILLDKSTWIPAITTSLRDVLSYEEIATLTPSEEGLWSIMFQNETDGSTKAVKVDFDNIKTYEVWNCLYEVLKDKDVSSVQDFIQVLSKNVKTQSNIVTSEIFENDYGKVTALGFYYCYPKNYYDHRYQFEIEMCCLPDEKDPTKIFQIHGLQDGKAIEDSVTYLTKEEYNEFFDLFFQNATELKYHDQKCKSEHFERMTGGSDAEPGNFIHWVVYYGNANNPWHNITYYTVENEDALVKLFEKKFNKEFNHNFITQEEEKILAIQCEYPIEGPSKNKYIFGDQLVYDASGNPIKMIIPNASDKSILINNSNDTRYTCTFQSYNYISNDGYIYGSPQLCQNILYYNNRSAYPEMDDNGLWKDVDGFDDLCNLILSKNQLTDENWIVGREQYMSPGSMNYPEFFKEKHWLIITNKRDYLLNLSNEDEVVQFISKMLDNYPQRSDFYGIPIEEAYCEQY